MIDHQDSPSAVDRELLELAAKAAGQERSAAGDLWSSARGALWAPLTDDGDAFRLALRLRIELTWQDGEPWAMYEMPGGEFWSQSGRPEVTQEAAARRAIVLAAAEIGKVAQ